jgi:hypothetical protein
VLRIGERRPGALDIGHGSGVAGAQILGIGMRPLELRLGDRDIGAGDREIGQRIVQARRDAVGVEAGENLAGLDGRILGNHDLAQFAGGLRHHGHGDERPQGAGRMHLGLDEAAVDGGDAIERMGLALTEIGAPVSGEGDERRQAEHNGAKRATDQRSRTQRAALC